MVNSIRNNIPNTIPYEIIIVDGNSTDGTIEWCESQPDIVLIKQHELVGAIRAFGAGFDIVRGQFTLILNDDVELMPESVIRALVYLQDHLTCGIAAIADNRKQPHKHDGEFDVDYMPALKDGQRVTVPYGQICLVRTWLGKEVGWWGHRDPAFSTSRTYAGDNRLSAKVFAMGYTVSKVPFAFAHDHIEHDALRDTNTECGAEDSRNYYRMFPEGPRIPQFPMLPQADLPTIRVLYLPIYEPGWEVQKTQKRGLRDALSRAKTPNGWSINVYELDYLSIPPKQLEAEIMRAADLFQPRIILTQIQGHLPITPAILMKLRTRHPRASIINFNGDYAFGGLTTPEMINLLRLVDLQLVVNGSALETYQKYQIPAAYWQIAAEEPDNPLPSMPSHDVVFMGSFNNPARLPFKAALEQIALEDGLNVGIYQPGDSAGTLYNFAKGKALYNNAKIAVGSNEYPDGYGFVSNRLFQAMAAGGCLYLQQKVDGLQELTGITAGVHYIQWTDFNDLKAQIRYFLKPENEADRLKISDAGTRYVKAFHSFDHRVQELFALMKKHLQPYNDVEANAVYVRYIGRMDEGFGIPSKTNEHVHYQYVPGVPLLIDRLDAPYFLAQSDLWELMET